MNIIQTHQFTTHQFKPGA